MADLHPFSPLAHRRDGPCPASMSNAGLTVTEVEGLGMLSLCVDLERRSDLRSVVETALGAPLPTPGVTSVGRLTAIWQSPDGCLLVGTVANAASVMADLSHGLEGSPALLDDVSHGLVALDLSGPDAAGLCPAPPIRQTESPRSAVGRFAGLRVTKLFDSSGVVRLFVEAADADYLWAWLADRLPALVGEVWP